MPRKGHQHPPLCIGRGCLWVAQWPQKPEQAKEQTEQPPLQLQLQLQLLQLGRLLRTQAAEEKALSEEQEEIQIKKKEDRV